MFSYAAQHVRGDERDQFLERAAYFFDASVSTLERLETRTLGAAGRAAALERTDAPVGRRGTRSAGSGDRRRLRPRRPLRAAKRSGEAAAPEWSGRPRRDSARPARLGRARLALDAAHAASCDVAPRRYRASTAHSTTAV